LNIEPAAAVPLAAGRRAPARRWGLRDWLVRGALILNLSLALSYVGLWLMAAHDDSFWRADFTAFYTAWTMVREGQGARLYDWDVQQTYQQRILDGHNREGNLLPYVNPPHVALALAPLALLPRDIAFLLWTAGQAGLLIYLFRLIWQLTDAWTRPEQWLALLAVAAFTPLLITFLLGTFSLLILVCLLQFYRGLRAGADANAAAWLVLATIKPQLVVLPGLIIMAGRRWRGLMIGALLGGCVAALSAAFFGWRIWPDFFHAVNKQMNVFDVQAVSPTIMYNLRGLMTGLLGNIHGAQINTLSTGMLALAIVATLLLWRGPWRPDEPVFALRFALTIMLGLLFCPHLFPQDTLLLVAPGLLFYDYLRRRDLPRRGYAIFILCCPTVFMLSQFVIGAQLPIHPPVLLMAALTIWMALALKADTSCHVTPA
jgi:hypothetical protein